ncbi:GntR family transcriptional regulator [Cellvibrio japonicus]|uniref:GntR-family transcriptional regulator n=1 Tax=Cellvibrio japonicus (strain Ueda107) TaxID=498211 RepID=B3PCC6_CELJU|nr:GntR family transcriptional regulator [Cellvibrio japonicus]ACE83073.1 GntR-family transcriptional regulator [Cellvibrio japonicus Ueda107]QEI11835.1 GntR family transcriptional regulator [Cellvibrio japonicus]QEI15409.1 GntR family transcriptional regulator [Cellvibrio japonicus]QEI18988.1 GntR family transcriptional regulator [Cellvibrio japonicus]
MKLIKTEKVRKKTDEPRTNVAERIYQTIKDDIFSFRLLPGERFSENEIAERVAASRTPVREALARLQREGFVEVSFRSGWQVKPFDFMKFEQLYDVRIVLELAAVKKLCEMEPAPNLEDLKRIWLVRPEDRLEDGPSVCALDERFHEQLVEATGNAEMARIHHEITERLRIVRRIDFTQANRIEATYEEHAKILRTIIERRAEDVKSYLKTHIEASKAEVRKITLHMLYEAQQQHPSSH